jgi:DNA-directed RNA polymerase III subunit RPC6
MASLTIRDRILQQCTASPQGVTQDVMLKSIEGVALVDLVGALNVLLREGRIRIFQASNSPDPVYKVVTQEEYEKLKGLPPECVLVYRLVEGAQRQGAWSKSLKIQSKLQMAQLQKVLKVLEQKQLVKSFKSVLAKNKRYYILFDLEPALEHQGGVGYGPDLEFDREFVDELNEQCYLFIVKEGFCSLEQIRNFIKETGISHVELQLDDVQKLVETLIYDGKVEEMKNPALGNATKRLNSAPTLYRPSRIQIPFNGLSATPCGRCPVFDLCNETGDITPATCIYLTEWLAPPPSSAALDIDPENDYMMDT